MRAIPSMFVLTSAILLLPGCIARTAIDVVTAPVKIVSKAADLATTSQSEADEKRGRELRMQEGDLGKLDRKRGKLAKKCDKGDRSACSDLARIKVEIRALNIGIADKPKRR